MEFEPRTAELIQSGATAAMLLDAQRLMCGALVEEVLNRIDRLVANDTMTPEAALGCVHELAAFRRILLRQAQKVEQGRRALPRNGA